MAHIEFPPAGTNAKSDEYLGLVKTGVIDTVSIGFNSHKSEPLSRGGVRFTDWSLLEISFVSVPANPNAVVTARANWGNRTADYLESTSETLMGVTRVCAPVSASSLT